MAAQRNAGSAGSLDPKLLVLSVIAAVVAAIVTGAFGWEKGTLLCTAVTPVIVAFTKEGLRRPVDWIGDIGRGSRHGRAPGGAETVGYAVAGSAGRPPYRTVYAPGRPRWKVALVTGLVAFAVGGGALTLSELFLGNAVTSDRETTLFSSAEPAQPEPVEERRPAGSTPVDPPCTETTPAEQPCSGERLEPPPCTETTPAEQPCSGTRAEPPPSSGTSAKGTAPVTPGQTEPQAVTAASP